MIAGQACGAGHGHALDSSLLIRVLREKVPISEEPSEHVTISENF